MWSALEWKNDFIWRRSTTSKKIFNKLKSDRVHGSQCKIGDQYPGNLSKIGLKN